MNVLSLTEVKKYELKPENEGSHQHHIGGCFNDKSLYQRKAKSISHACMKEFLSHMHLPKTTSILYRCEATVVKKILMQVQLPKNA